MEKRQGSQVFVDDHTHARLKAVAGLLRQPMSAIATKAVEYYLNSISEEISEAQKVQLQAVAGRAHE